MIRAAQQKDIPRIAEIIVFGKRVAYRDIFQKAGHWTKIDSICFDGRTGKTDEENFPLGDCG